MGQVDCPWSLLWQVELDAGLVFVDWLIDLCYLRCILGSVPDISTELGRVELDDLLVELKTIEGNIDNLTTIKHLQLKTMGTIRFQVQVSNQHTILNRIYFYQTFSRSNSILVTQYFLKN